MSRWSRDVMLFLKEHVPTYVGELTKLADQYREARSVGIREISAQPCDNLKKVADRFCYFSTVMLISVSSLCHV